MSSPTEHLPLHGKSKKIEEAVSYERIVNRQINLKP